MSGTGGGDQLTNSSVEDTGVHCTLLGGELGTEKNILIYKMISPARDAFKYIANDPKYG